MAPTIGGMKTGRNRSPGPAPLGGVVSFAGMQLGDGIEKKENGQRQLIVRIIELKRAPTGALFRFTRSGIDWTTPELELFVNSSVYIRLILKVYVCSRFAANTERSVPRCNSLCDRIDCGWINARS